MIKLLKKVCNLLNLTGFKFGSIFILSGFVSILQVIVSIYLSDLIDKYTLSKTVILKETKYFFIILFLFIISKNFLKYVFSFISIKFEFVLNKYCIQSVSPIKNDVIINLQRISKLRSFFDSSLESIFYIPLLFVLTFFGAYVLDPLICVMILPVVLISILVDIKLSPKLLASSKEYYELENRVFKFQKDMIENKEQILLKDIKDYVIDYHIKKQRALLNSMNRLTKRKQISYTPALLNEYMPTIVLIIVSSIKVYFFDLSYGKFMGLLSLVVGVSLPFTRFLRVMIELKSLNFLINDLIKIKDVATENKKNINIKVKTDKKFDFENVVEITNLDFKYGEDNYIFKNLSFNLKLNEKIAIIGETGTGKTTFLKILLGLNSTLNSSLVKVFGVNVIENRREIWNKIGYVDNNNYLFNKSVIYNITFKEDLSESELTFLKDISKKLNILELVNENFVIQEFGRNLSGGQKLKICIARALFRKPKLLILDEPTASFDKESENKFCESLNNIEITALIVTHRKKICSICDEVYEIKNASLIRR